MTLGASPAVVRQIESLFDGGSVAGLTDRQLLERFTGGDDAMGEAAFAGLVRRHGPMVLSLCHQLVGDRHHAEDVFQAVFLVLARKARSIRAPELLGNWLYGVTLRAALKARVRLVRQRKREEVESMTHHAPYSGIPPVDAVAAREQAEALHDEIGRLPDAFRLPVVLCYLEGLTVEEAAGQLKCSDGTVRSRLARARDKLRRGLTRRGVALPAGVLAVGLTPRGASASIPSTLCDAVARSALEFAAGRAAGAVSAPAMALAREVIRSMLIHKLRFLAMTVLFVGAVASGAGYWRSSLAKQDEPAKSPTGQKPAIAAKPVAANQNPAPGRMVVVGRVLGPQGKPVPNASVMVYARSNILRRETVAERAHPTEIGRAVSDASGRFRVEATRTSSSRHDGLGAVALAPGYGTGWAGALDPDVDQPIADITLRSEQPIHGRLFDLQGQPARDVKLLVTAMRPPASSGDGVIGEELDNPSFCWNHPDDLPGWPAPAITGADGRFTVHGVGLGVRVFMSVIDSRYTSPVIEITTDVDFARRPLSLVLQLARTLTGRVNYADTGKPAANALVTVSGFEQFQASIGPRTIFTLADSEGRFHANIGPDPAGNVAAEPAGGQPYLAKVRRIDWSKGAVTRSVDLALPRGVMLHGKVTEQGSNRAVSSAAVMFFPHRSTNDDNSPVASFPLETSADGSFSLAVPAGRGFVVVRGPGDEYVLHELDTSLLVGGQSGGLRVYAHAFVPCDSSTAGSVQAVLRPGATVKGRVVGPDGQPIAECWMLSRIHLNRRSPVLQMWSANQHGLARNGQFELHGLDPDSEIAVSFFEPKRKLGATVRFGGKPPDGEPTVVKLEPCATATARLVGPDGKPLAKLAAAVVISMVVTPGESSVVIALKKGTSLADAAMLRMIDPINHPNDPASDGQGRVVVPALIPGATYRVVDRFASRNANGHGLRREFTVKADETVDLGDILIEKPRAD